ncbi:MAG: rod shape-determining protein RodA [Bacteroidales bacterium]|jgi:rod shape determining protein RodA|nr:rod shape-determining protein RodA [Bacteroidales bacterium]MBO7346812.1 rod shape-determining protein RodA [Bacteroidales bacterium]MBR4453195.1 rod shape-determining protein RodA [Bacteroidales bacterium]MCR5555445.1 rod shape-determining protein RodA [Bacteroidales bacterium]
MKTMPDKTIIIIYLLLLLIGWLSIFSTSYDGNFNILAQGYGNQLIWIASSLVIALFVFVLNPRFFSNTATIWYVLFALLLVVVIFAGKEVNGGKSWLGVGNFGIQPSEFAKYATCLLYAKYASNVNCDLSKPKDVFKAAIIILLPVFLIVLQHDVGSAIPFIFLIFAMYREGLNGWIIMIGVLAVALFIMYMVMPKWLIFTLIVLVFVFLFAKTKKKKKYAPWLILSMIVISGYVLSLDFVYSKIDQHQRDRIDLLFGKIDDPKKVGYNVNQAKIAIGSGGFFGKGFQEGTQTKGKFVPEQQTDFIFCTIGEERGFLGAFVVVVLYVLLFVRIILLSESNQDAFVRIYGYSIVCILFAHFVINIGMTIGLMPTIGIPLPYISYGGSSLWAFTLMLFTFVNIEAKSHGWNMERRRRF